MSIFEVRDTSRPGGWPARRAECYRIVDGYMPLEKSVAYRLNQKNNMRKLGRGFGDDGDYLRRKERWCH